MIAVKFNVASEFCEELSKEVPVMPRKIVRLTNSMRPSGLSPSIRHLSVIATFLTTLPDGQLGMVRLEHYCGDLWGMNRDEEVRAKAQKVEAEISETCKKLGLEVRSGVLEDAPAPAKV